ncbi:phosphoenolpyruvate synthase [Candidatus Babeliales bacterium]|nr:phosphoenolpyruvate synthase [Candidatus Babeliales bacterium]
MKYIKNFKTINLQDIPTVGGKNASLGQMIQDLTKKGIAVPQGFALTAQAYWLHLEKNNLVDRLKVFIKKLHKKTTLSVIHATGKEVRTLIESADFPQELIKEIEQAYEKLSKSAQQKNCSVAVRSSATAEDLPDASFAGQQETFLNISGKEALVQACKKCMSSLFTDRAIVYRIEKGFDHFSVGLSVGVQQMVRSDKASAGVIFTVDTETGFKDVVVITSSYGLGETIVGGEVVPDEFHVFKKTFKTGFIPLIKKFCGSKKRERVYGKTKNSIIVKNIDAVRRAQFSLTDEEVLLLTKYALIIEDHYSNLKGAWSPMDIEWAKDGITGKLYIVQARPETVHGFQQEKKHILKIYTLKNKESAVILAEGQSIGNQAISGKACLIHHPQDINSIKKGDIIITRMTDPDWLPLMKKASGIITESGGRTCHAAIVSRELGIPAIVGAPGVLKKIQHGQMITMDCSSGSVGTIYKDKLDISIQEIVLSQLKKTKTSILVNIAAPDRAYQTSELPVDGVGLARLEFIITNQAQVHPMACLFPEKIETKKMRDEIYAITAAYKTPAEFFMYNIAQGAGTIAAAFYPRPVLIRFSDFKSNEYKNLIGGKFFEPHEENPMIGLRGASRYTHELYAPAFELECKALKYAREVMGLDNINIMIPFVRTLTEAKNTIELLKKHGLVSGQKGLKIYMMCEIPSNVILIDEFSKYFDGFSIGSNDLTQTTLSVDRDSQLLSKTFDERDPAVMIMLQAAIEGAHAAGRPIGICGQAPSDYPEIAEFLMLHKIDTMSLNADSVLPFLSQK